MTRHGELPLPDYSLMRRVGVIPGPDEVAAARERYLSDGVLLRDGIFSVLPDGWSFDDKRVLDFGCGAGRVLRQLLAEGEAAAEFWACDIHAPSIEWINANLAPPFRAISCGTWPPLELPDASFDLIYSVSVFSHLSDNASAWLLELRRLLRPDGVLIATYQGPSMWAQRGTASTDPPLDDVGHHVYAHGDSFWDSDGPQTYMAEWWLREHWGRAFDIEYVAEWITTTPYTQNVVVMRPNGRACTPDEIDAPNVDDPREARGLALSRALILAELAWVRDQHRRRVEDVARGSTAVVSDDRDPTSARPALSVVIPTRHPFSRLGELVDAHVTQLRELGGELVIVGGAGEPSEHRNGVRFVASETADIMSLRARGLEVARGDVIAFGEDHAFPRPGWAPEVVRAHAGAPDAAVVVGRLSNATDATSSARGNFLSFAAPFASPSADVRRPPPLSVVSVKRSALSDRDLGPGRLETEFLPRVFATGRLVMDDRIVVDHHQAFGLFTAVRNAFAVARTSYGYARDRWSPQQRREVARWALVHIAPRAVNEARAELARIGGPRRDLVVVGIISASSAVGAALGALVGPGSAAEHAA